ncbi:hypothetical protein LXL04_030082 [Taraxacum kok-saghyz]
MDGAKPVATPLSSSKPLSPTDGSPGVDPTPLSPISRFSTIPCVHSPGCVLCRYCITLKGTIHHGLYLNRGSPLDLKAFSDFDWRGVSNGGRSTTAYILYLGSNIISWRSARQKSVSRSSTEAEYKALANAAAELAWVHNLLLELGVCVSGPPTLFCDNIGVYVFRVLLLLQHVHSTDQLADILTKPLGRRPFLLLRSKIGVSDGSSILRGRITDHSISQAKRKGKKRNFTHPAEEHPAEEFQAVRRRAPRRRAVRRKAPRRGIEQSAEEHPAEEQSAEKHPAEELSSPQKFQTVDFSNSNLKWTLSTVLRSIMSLTPLWVQQTRIPRLASADGFSEWKYRIEKYIRLSNPKVWRSMMSGPVKITITNAAL